MAVKISIEDKKLNRQIANALKVAPREALNAMFECTQHLAGVSAIRAPVESGDLRNNCHATIQGVTVYENQRNVSANIQPSEKIAGTVGYSLPYALRQHEDLGLRHDRSDGYRVPAQNIRTGEINKNAGMTVNLVPGGESKFLEKPFNENKEKYIRRFEKIVEDSIK